MSGVRLRGAPAVPWLSAFPELNVRTYVKYGGKPGVWFFSLDAGNALAVAIARVWFHLPYFRARMSCDGRDGYIYYRSGRTHRRAPSAVLKCRYRPSNEVFYPQPGTLEYFLTERYCLYASGGNGRLICVEIHHPPGRCNWRKLSSLEIAWRERREWPSLHECLFSILRKDRTW